MWRLTILESPAEQRFVVEGKLMQPWVSELESAWESARDARRGRRCVVDLSETTGIDRSGRRLLMAMCGEGVRFIAKGGLRKTPHQAPKEKWNKTSALRFSRRNRRNAVNPVAVKTLAGDR